MGMIRVPPGRMANFCPSGPLGQCQVWALLLVDTTQLGECTLAREEYLSLLKNMISDPLVMNVEWKSSSSRGYPQTKPRVER